MTKKAAEIRRTIANGEAGPGEGLPLAKDMAAVLGVNKNTVLQALRMLRDNSLLDSLEFDPLATGHCPI